MRGKLDSLRYTHEPSSTVADDQWFKASGSVQPDKGAQDPSVVHWPKQVLTTRSEVTFSSERSL